jgi:hypothetical protein
MAQTKITGAQVDVALSDLSDVTATPVAGQVLRFNGSDWTEANSADGPFTSVQYNDNGALTGSAGLSFNGTNTLVVGNGTSGSLQFAGAGSIFSGGSIAMYAAGGVMSGDSGSDVYLFGGDANGAGGGLGGTASLIAGSSTTGGGGNANVSAGTGSNPGNGGLVTLSTNGLARLAITTTGAWVLGGSTAGNPGEVLTSNGSTSAPTWQAAGGGGVSEPLNQVVVGTGTGADSFPLFLYSNAAGIFAVNSSDLTGTGTPQNAAGGVLLASPKNTTGAGYGSATILLGSTGATGTSSVTVSAGNADGAADGGNVSILAGGADAGNGGAVILSAGTTSGGAAGTIDLKTFGVTRFSVGTQGEFIVAGSAGSSGDVLISQGSGDAPYWGTPSASAPATSQVYSLASASNGTFNGNILGNFSITLFTSAGATWVTPDNTVYTNGFLFGSNGKYRIIIQANIAATATILPDTAIGYGSVLETDANIPIPADSTRHVRFTATTTNNSHGDLDGSGSANANEVGKNISWTDVYHLDAPAGSLFAPSLFAYCPGTPAGTFTYRMVVSIERLSAT